MASLQKIKRKDKKGKPRTAYRIVLSNRDKRTVISLGIMPKKTADTCLSMVEQIAAANAAGQSCPVEVATWTANIGDDLPVRRQVYFFQPSILAVCVGLCEHFSRTSLLVRSP